MLPLNNFVLTQNHTLHVRHARPIINKELNCPFRQHILRKVQCYHTTHRHHHFWYGIVSQFVSYKFYGTHLASTKKFTYLQNCCISQLSICEIKKIQSIIVEVIENFIKFLWHFDHLQFLFRRSLYFLNENPLTRRFLPHDSLPHLSVGWWILLPKRWKAIRSKIRLRIVRHILFKRLNRMNINWFLFGVIDLTLKQTLLVAGWRF